METAYTNVMSFDLDWVRSAEVQSIMSAVYASGCIVSNRWGDLILCVPLPFFFTSTYKVFSWSPSWLHNSAASRITWL